MRAFGASPFPTAHLLLSEVHLWLNVVGKVARALQLSFGEDQETSELMAVEIFDRIEQIAVEGHQATDRGAKSLRVVRRSVRVHP